MRSRAQGDVLRATEGALCLRAATRLY